MQRIIKNKIKCKKCGDILESRARHDFKMCSCNSCGVDGGLAYLRRIGDPEDWIEMSETKEETNVTSING